MQVKHLKSDNEWMNKNKRTLQDKHTYCIKIFIQKQTIFYMQAMFKETSKNASENGVMKPMISIVEET